jgi:hypothetical protein
MTQPNVESQGRDLNKEDLNEAIVDLDPNHENSNRRDEMPILNVRRTIRPLLGTLTIVKALFQRTRVESMSGECVMGLGKGALLWLLGVPLPIIILLILFWR